MTDTIDAAIVKLETKRDNLHNYIAMKLEERDYHAVADAAMDLREIDREIHVRMTLLLH